MVLQMQLTSHRTNITVLTLALLLTPVPSLATIGTVTQQIGQEAKISRDSDTIIVGEGTGINMNDTIVTTKSRLALTFDDNTKVAITQQSKLVIDDFVYDPATGVGSLAMNVAMGTVRYASGAIARNSRENVRLRTPTATIAVRGTDFTMTVDEIGRSLIILLPSCHDPLDPNNCWTGEIEVSTEVGMVLLNQAFQATVVSTSTGMPSKPKVINILEPNINNMLIISPPKELPGGMAYIDQAESSSFLEDDALLFDELIEEYLDDNELSYGELDIDWLDMDFLDNLLDLTNMLADDELAIDPVLPNIHQFKSYIQYSYNEEGIFLYSERPPHIAQVRLERYVYGYVNIEQDGVMAPLQINDGGSDVIINITQSN